MWEEQPEEAGTGGVGGVGSIDVREAQDLLGGGGGATDVAVCGGAT